VNLWQRSMGRLAKKIMQVAGVHDGHEEKITAHPRIQQPRNALKVVGSGNARKGNLEQAGKVCLIPQEGMLVQPNIGQNMRREVKW
jgi:hypothetical protein